MESSCLMEDYGGSRMDGVMLPITKNLKEISLYESLTIYRLDTAGHLICLAQKGLRTFIQTSELQNKASLS